MALGDRMIHIMNMRSSLNLETLCCGALHDRAKCLYPTPYKEFDGRFVINRITSLVCLSDLSEEELYKWNTQPISDDTIRRRWHPKQRELHIPHNRCRTGIGQLCPRFFARRLIPDLLRVSKEAHIEGTKLLYSTNTFSFDCIEVLKRFLAQATVDQRSQIEYLRLTMNFQGHGTYVCGTSLKGHVKRAPHPGIVAWSRLFSEVMVPLVPNLESLSLCISLEGRRNYTMCLSIAHHLRQEFCYFLITL